jgi:hypothetical protein
MLIASERAWEILRPLISSAVEALPVIHPSGVQYYALNLLHVIDCLQVDRCITNRRPDAPMAKFSAVYTYAFNEEVVRGQHLFRCPQMKGLEIYVSSAFKEVVESNGLIGLRFVKIYPPPLPGPVSSSTELEALHAVPASGPGQYTETPLEDDVLEQLEDAREMGRANLGLDRYGPDASALVSALDRFVDRWQQEEVAPTGELYGDEKPDIDDVALAVGINWGDQIVRELGWEWTSLSESGQPGLFCVVSPDRAYVIYPLHFVKQLLTDPEEDNTLLLIFNMACEAQLPPSAPNTYLPLTDGRIRHSVPKG